MSKSKDLLNKTWTLTGSKENLNEEQFEDAHLATRQSCSRLNGNVTIELKSDHESKRIELSLRSSSTSVNLSSRDDAFMPEFRSLNVDTTSRNHMGIEHFFNRYGYMDYVSLFDENTNGLEFELVYFE